MFMNVLNVTYNYSLQLTTLAQEKIKIQTQLNDL